MNSDFPTTKAPNLSDKSLVDMLGEMAKASVIKEPENNAQSQNNLATSMNNNLNVRDFGHIHPQDPRTRNQSIQNTVKLETVAWGRTFSESSSPQVVVKSENQVKKEVNEPDELAKMMMILQDSFKSSAQSHAANPLPSHPASPAMTIKEEGASEESDKLHNFNLLKQREEYVKKAVSLQKKIYMIKQRRQELRGDGQRSLSPETKMMLKENTKMELGHRQKLKNINSLIEMLDGIINEKVRQKEKTSTEATREIKVPPQKRFNYVFYDSELHWCRVCNVFPATATYYLAHLHSQDHKAKVAAGYMEAPWRSTVSDDSFPTHPLADIKRMPIKGLQFFVPSTAWYCKLCDQLIGDMQCTSAHLKSVTHFKNYSIFMKENPHWESDWMLDRQKAFEDSRLTVCLEEVDSFNIESINVKESPQKEIKKPEKHPSNPTSDSDSDMESVKKEKEKRVKKAALKRLEPLITDRKLLDNINSTKLPNNVSPPRSYRDREDRRSEARHDDRYSTRYDRQRQKDRYLRQDTYPSRHDRSPSGHHSRSSERRRERSIRERSEVRSGRERSEVRSGRERSEVRSGRERSEVRSGRERSEVRSGRERSEVRSGRERSEVRSGRERSEVRSVRERSCDSPVSTPVIDSTDRKNPLVGKITPFKIMGPNDESYALKKKKEEMVLEIKKKVDEFQEQLNRIQSEKQPPKSVPTPLPIPAPTNPPPANPAPTNPPPPNPASAIPAFADPSDDLDMNQVVEMANQILQQQAMLGAPFGMEPMCMPPPMAPMTSILGPPPMSMGMPRPLMRMPFMPFMGGRMPIIENRNRKRKLGNWSNNNGKREQKKNTICPPGEDK